MYERIGGLRARQRGASLGHRRSEQPGQRPPRRLGRRDQQRPGHARPDPPRRPLQDREAATRRSRSRSRSAPARSTSPGTSTSSTTRTRRSCAYALAPIFNAEMKDLVEAGAKYLQLEDLGAWLPLFTDNENDYKWISDVVEQVLRRRGRQDRLALLLRQRLGQRHPQRQLPGGLSDGPAALLRHAGHRRVRARLREPRHGGHRVPEEPPEGQGGPGRRPGHPHDA